MIGNWSFGQKLGGGFAVVVALAMVVGAIAVYALRDVTVIYEDLGATDYQLLINAERLNSSSEWRTATVRGFLFTEENRFLDNMRQARSEFQETLSVIRAGARTEEGRRHVDAIGQSEGDYQVALDQAIALRRTSQSADEVERFFTDRVLPSRNELRDKVRGFVDLQERLLSDARQDVRDETAFATTLLILTAVIGAILAGVFAFLLARALNSQVGTAVGQIQSSSTELQAAASQQASGTKEQSMAMNEIVTTISELLATSRQISESAQRVAGIAGETSRSALSGEGTVDKTNETISSIKSQVDQIVNHMLNLGKKSQEIGAVLDIVTELADQTNIVSINATIEAAGAGETGRRFGVVAEEIRRLADRVGESTKDIRRLIDDVRGAVNTTVMATEGGSKAVDAGSRQFGDLTSAFKHIAGLVSTTTEAAQEIELSTKQQATAVEQVNAAISNVAQATRETEASSAQTLQTASQLTNLARDLQQLIQARGNHESTRRPL